MGSGPGEQWVPFSSAQSCPAQWPGQRVLGVGGRRPKHCTLVVRGFSIHRSWTERQISGPAGAEAKAQETAWCPQAQVTSAKAGWHSGAGVARARAGPAAVVSWHHFWAVKAPTWSWEEVSSSGL